MERAGVSNSNQLAEYLSEKYGVTITRQNVYQFKNSKSVTITSLLLREALSNP